MKIIHLIPSLVKGGAERITLDIYEELMKYPENEVKLVYFRDINDYKYLTDKLKVQKINISFQLSLKSSSKGDVKELEDLINEFQPDIIHSHLLESEIMLSQINYTKAKYIVHFHDNMYQLKKWNGRFSKQHLTDWYERKVVVKSYKSKQVKFIGISNNTMAYMHKNLPRHSTKHLLLNGVKLDRFREVETQKRENLSMVMIASLVDKKNQELAIKVVKELHKRGYLFKLYLLGDGKNKNTLIDQVRESSLENYVLFKGNVDNPEDYLRASEIYLHTAKYEPFGLVLIEAMAAGIPIVCTDGKGNRDIIQNYKNGIINDTFEVNDIANDIIKVHLDDSLKTKLVKNAKEYCEQYDIKLYVQKLMEIYKH
jgi:glycosyltransferase involved in cell wall biosynthesis